MHPFTAFCFSLAIAVTSWNARDAFVQCADEQTERTRIEMDARNSYLAGIIRAQIMTGSEEEPDQSDPLDRIEAQ